MRLYHPTWKDKDGQRHRSGRWWLDFTDSHGRRWRLPGLTDRRQTEALGRNVDALVAVRVSGDSLPADLLRWLEDLPGRFRERLADAGLIDRQRAGGLAPLMELDADDNVTGGHLAAFLADAEARGVSPTQRQMLAQRIRDVLQKAGVTWLRDLSAGRIQAAIAAFGEPTEKRPAGLSKQSLHHYVRAAKQFSRWLHRERRTADDALVGLKGYNAETDPRHRRRGFTADEMAVLLAATRKAETRWGMTGPTRAAAYTLAFASGLRRNEIRTLTAGSFDLQADPPTVTVEAAYSKHRRTDVQPLPADVAEMLGDFLADADADRPFPLPDKTAKMLRGDMAEGREAWIKRATTPQERTKRTEAGFLSPRDADGLVLDFHSFRHGYVTAICQAPVSPRVMMELARHSDPRLTMKRYSRVATADSALALDALPKLAGDDKPQPLRQTGTMATVAPPDPDGRFATRFAKSCGFDRTSADSGGLSASEPNCEKALADSGKAAIIKAKKQQAPVAQMDRASVYGTEATNTQPPESSNTCDDSSPSACHSLCQTRAETAPLDPDLAALVKVWPDLPQAVRAGIVAMVKAASAE